MNKKHHGDPLPAESRRALDKRLKTDTPLQTVSATAINKANTSRLTTRRIHQGCAKATSAKAAFTLRFSGEENERELRKLFFVAMVDITDQSMSNIAQPLVRISLKLLQLLRKHRAVHVGVGAYAVGWGEAVNPGLFSV